MDQRCEKLLGFDCEVSVEGEIARAMRLWATGDVPGLLWQSRLWYH